MCLYPSFIISFYYFYDASSYIQYGSEESIAFYWNGIYDRNSGSPYDASIVGGSCWTLRSLNHKNIIINGYAYITFSARTSISAKIVSDYGLSHAHSGYCAMLVTRYEENIRSIDIVDSSVYNNYLAFILSESTSNQFNNAYLYLISSCVAAF